MGKLERNFDFVQIKPFYEENNTIVLKNDCLEIRINKLSGQIEKYAVDGKNVIKSIKLKSYNDNTDPWCMNGDEFNKIKGEFLLEEPIKVIENGDVRIKLQSVWRSDKSVAVMTYIFSKRSAFADIDVKILSADKNTMHKLCIETELSKEAAAYCQTMFGTEETHKNGKESVFQKWCGLKDENSSVAVLNNGTYGGSFSDNEIRISLLRTPVYAAHPDDEDGRILEDREYNHIDIGERSFSFRICVNEEFNESEAEIFNQKPFVLSFFPSGSGKKIQKNVKIDNRHIILSALKKTDNGTLIRLYNSSSKAEKCKLSVDNEIFDLSVGAFEVKTFIKNGKLLNETNMLGK